MLIKAKCKKCGCTGHIEIGDLTIDKAKEALSKIPFGECQFGGWHVEIGNIMNYIEIDPIEELAFKTRDLLIKEEAMLDVAIYFNNKKLSTDKLEENINVKDYLEYNNPDTITMTFEGTLNHDINYGSGRIYKKLEKLFNLYGYYSEQGYAWSLALYKL